MKRWLKRTVWPFKLRRYLDWFELVLQSPPSALWRMFLAVLSGRVDRAIWRRRMFTCYRCPIHGRLWDPQRRRWQFRQVCRFKGDVATLGCGCYTPFKARARTPYASAKGRGCWGRAVMGEGFGWG